MSFLLCKGGTVAQEEVAGFTKKQRQFFLDVYGHQCAFHWKVNGRWVRCKNTRNLQIHHIVPRGWCRENMNRRFPTNGAGNGIALCPHHHVGPQGVHPDTYEAKIAYREGNRKAYEVMMAKRREMNKDGRPYWDTTWDMMFARLNKRFVSKYLHKNPGVKYPINGNRYTNGRIRRKKKR